MSIKPDDRYVRWFSTLTLADRASVGGKNASLGELMNHLRGVALIPDGFALTSAFFEDLLSSETLNALIDDFLDVDGNIKKGKEIEDLASILKNTIINASFVSQIKKHLLLPYKQLDPQGKGYFAIRSSSVEEDGLEHSFAGQHDTLLGIKGFSNVVNAVIEVYASVFNVRALRYRLLHGLPLRTQFSVGIQKMAYDSKMCSGVMFTADPETKESRVILISSSYGLGEAIVSGQISPDEFLIYKKNVRTDYSCVLKRTLGTKENYIKLASQGVQSKKVTIEKRQQFSLSDSELTMLSQIGVAIEKHYGYPMDIEWAKVENAFYILQARPITTKHPLSVKRLFTQYVLKSKGALLLQGRPVGHHIVSGPVKIIKNSNDLHRIRQGDILVTVMTDMSWESVLPKLAGLVTDKGGRTCHAAIVARELGIPTLVGTENATMLLKEGMMITLDCSSGEHGYIYEGKTTYEVIEEECPAFDKLPVELMLNVSKPEQAFYFSTLPSSGIGLVRLEFIINNTIKIHPLALLKPEILPLPLQKKIRKMSQGYSSFREFYIAKLVEGLGTIAAAFDSRMVIIRFSDLKSNEYRQLIGGSFFESIEENPMLGFRGAARYISDEFKEAFRLECEAIGRLRSQMGLHHIVVMIPFVRTVEELKKTLQLMEHYGLKRGQDGLKVLMNCELPCNIILAKEFLELVDGYSVGSNDLTQLTLGIDRDAGKDILLEAFDERNPAVLKQLESMLIQANSMNKYVGICGQGPSDHYDFAKFLIKNKITSISLNPDQLFKTLAKIVHDPDLTDFQQ